MGKLGLAHEKFDVKFELGLREASFYRGVCLERVYCSCLYTYQCPQGVSDKGCGIDIFLSTFVNVPTPNTKLL